MNKMGKKEDKSKNIWKILLVLCVVGVLACVVAMLMKGNQRRAAEENYEELQEMSVSEEETEGVLVEESSEEKESELGVDIPEKNIDFEAISQENDDVYAWIYIPETKVDYPVLQHPTDDSYYLNHNMDGSAGYPGCIYTELLNEKDFTDPNTVLYGHNMDDDTMFGSLHDFENEDFFEEDHYIYVYTTEDVYVYQVFAAYEYPAIHLLYNFNLDDPAVYADYVAGIYESKGRVANIREDIQVTAEDKIITLSTCTTDHENSLRFLVQGVLLNAD